MRSAALCDVVDRTAGRGLPSEWPEIGGSRRAHAGKRLAWVIHMRASTTVALLGVWVALSCSAGLGGGKSRGPSGEGGAGGDDGGVVFIHPAM